MSEDRGTADVSRWSELIDQVPAAGAVQMPTPAVDAPARARTPAQDIAQWVRDSTTLNALAYEIAGALGKVSDGEDYFGDVTELVRELIADRDSARADSARLLVEAEKFAEPLREARAATEAAEAAVGEVTVERDRLKADLMTIAGERLANQFSAAADLFRPHPDSDPDRPVKVNLMMTPEAAKAYGAVLGKVRQQEVTLTAEDVQRARQYAELLAETLAKTGVPVPVSDAALLAEARRHRDTLAVRVDYLETLTDELGRKLEKARDKSKRRRDLLASAEAALRDFQAAHRNDQPVVKAAEPRRPLPQSYD